jgi:integrase
MEKTYELTTKVPGVRARHRAACGAKDKRRCSCGDALRYVARVYDPTRRGGKGGYRTKAKRTLDEAGSWKRKEETRKAAGISAETTATLAEVGELLVSEARAGRALNRYGRPWAPRSINALESALRQPIGPKLGKRRVADIDEGVIQHFVDDLMGDYADNSVRSIINQLSNVLDYAAARKYRDGRPKLSEVRQPAKPPTSKRAPTVPVAFKLIEALPESDRDLWWIFALTGGRNIEVVTAEWEHADFKANVLHLAQVVAKTPNAPRAIPMGTMARRILLARRARMGLQPGLIFPPATASAKRMNQSSFVEKARTHWDRQGLASYTPHEFRHGFSTWLNAAGVNPLVRRTLMGQTLGDLDGTYVHIDSGELAKGIEQFETYVSAFFSTPVHAEVAHEQ